ncbi:MAG: hypothetical protein AB8I08_36765 [Sandaracinaceae bacterium]
MTARTGLASVLALLLLSACGAEEPAESTPPQEELADEIVAPEPEPEPVPVPVEIPSCPEDQWGVAANGPTRGTESGVEAAGWVRSMGNDWSSLRVCKTIDGQETRLSCAPIERGGECELFLGNQRCSATLPQPLIPAAVGMLIDTGEQPTEGTWTCGRR